MVNYRRMVCEVALLAAIVAVVKAAPTPDCTHSIHYDQRQNGSENYRLNIDGVVVAVAPAESIFSALGDMDELMDLLSLEDFNTELKPPPVSSSSPSNVQPVSIDVEKPLPKPQDKPDVKPEAEKVPQDKPEEVKPQEDKPVVPIKPVESSALSDVSMGDDMKIQKKEVALKKQEKAKRLKNRLASFLMPLLRKTRHH